MIVSLDTTGNHRQPDFLVQIRQFMLSVLHLRLAASFLRWRSEYDEGLVLNKAWREETRWDMKEWK